MENYQLYFTIKIALFQQECDTISKCVALESAPHWFARDIGFLPSFSKGILSVTCISHTIHLVHKYLLYVRNQAFSAFVYWLRKGKRPSAKQAWDFPILLVYSQLTSKNIVKLFTFL